MCRRERETLQCFLLLLSQDVDFFLYKLKNKIHQRVRIKAAASKVVKIIIFLFSMLVFFLNLSHLI